MECFWPSVVKNPTGNKPIDDFGVLIDDVPKIVYSWKLESVEWKHTTLKKEIIKEAILELKHSWGGGSKDILIGSTSLIVAFA